MDKKKKIIIIGGGISGLSSGIYALDNGYDVTIYEKNIVPGGECSYWFRDNMYIEGCAHFIVGTNENSILYPLWNHVGAFDSSTIIHDTDYFSKYDIDGEIVTLYADIDKLKNELLRVSSEDEKQIKRMIKGIKIYQRVNIPVKKPIDKMNIFELINYGFSMLIMVPRLIIYMHQSIDRYKKRFKSPVIKELLSRVMDNNYNIHSLIYVLQSLSLKDAGVIEGGSKTLIDNIVKTYLAKGGKICLNKPVEKVLIDNNKAVGVILKDKETVESDYVISTTDAFHTLFNLLEGKYYDDFYVRRFRNRKKNPLIQGMQGSFKVNKIYSDLPKMINFKIKPIKISNALTIDNITIRNFSFDKKVSVSDSTVFTTLIDCNDKVYDYFKSLNKDEYRSVKKDILEKLRKEIVSYFKLDDDMIKSLDLTTPLTYERYCNAYRGSYMSFLTTKNVKGLMRAGVIKGLSNFYLAGQWIMPPGGLPIALFSAKHAVYRIARKDKKHFTDLDVVIDKIRKKKEKAA